MTEPETPKQLSPESWDTHYQNANTPWDLGGITPALAAWDKAHPLKGLHLLVPGCGRGHDPHFASRRGAVVTAVDYAESALTAARAAHPQSRVTWHRADVTTMTFDTPFDLVWEYTCFCALDPGLRRAYLRAVCKALRPGGLYFGMVFLSVPNPENGPPFQIGLDAFRDLLSETFDIEVLEPAGARSVNRRAGSEIWFQARAPLPG